MCFSATASFGISAVLVAGGVVALKKVHHRSQHFFAAIPILFGIQQFFEGFVWLALRHAEHQNWLYPAAFSFLFFAQVLWPAWVPIAILGLEKDPFNRKILKGLSALGILLSLYLAFCLVQYPLHVDISGFHVRYQWSSPDSAFAFSGILYFFATVVPPMISKDHATRIMGALICVSLIVTRIYFHEFIISVWCYFAAGISLMVLYILSEIGKESINASTAMGAGNEILSEKI